MKSKDMRLLNRREFNGLCVALGSFASPTRAAGLDAAAGAASTGAGRTAKFRDGTVVPALGQGSAGLGKGKHPQAVEEEAVRTGLSLGMTLIDTAELYGSEEFIGRAIAGQRNRVFLVSKVWPSHVGGNGVMHACEASLERLGTDHLDLYLLHWPNGVTNLSSVVTAFENLRSAAKIRAWGVFNFKVSDMEDLFRIPKGDSCATNQLPYSLGDRGIERDLLPWCQQRSDKLLFIINRTIRNQVGDAKIVYLAAVSMSCEVRKLVESGKEFLLINDIAAKLGQSDAFNIVLPTDKEITHRPACSIKFDPRKGLSARRSSRCT